MGDITVKSISHSVIRIRVLREDIEWLKRPRRVRSLKVVEVLRDGEWERLGFAVPKSGRYPTKIRVITLELSTGATFTFHDRTIRVAVDQPKAFVRKLTNGIKPAAPRGWCDDDRIWTKLFPRQQYRKGVHLALPGGLRLNYGQAAALKVGQVVVRSQPLRLKGLDSVTDGIIRIPLARPHGHAWSDHGSIKFSQKITAVNWKLFLRAIVGQHVSDIVEESSLRPVVKSRMGMVKRREQDRERARKVGECFAGHKAIKSIAIGSNLVFTLQKGDETVYVVDSPEYATALYVFDEYRHAYSWASRAIGWREARELARMVKIHRGAWRDAVAVALEPCTV